MDEDQKKRKTRKKRKISTTIFVLLYCIYSDIEFKVFDEDQTKATRNKKKKTKKKKEKKIRKKRKWVQSSRVD